ncbi:MAG: DUF2939 domain-containing protein [Hyphomicrobiaceae bacterium TMED74]|nr:hypothetical protein [Filomicrobium sp.]RPG35604.1 MAG: DUF2939 domain-containing protein [Hyphomicrobiaceae bacterium TMED74]
MGRLLVAILFALIVFYIAWPAVSAWQIYGAVQDKDPSALSSKVDFLSVRESMRPAVEARISWKIEEMKQSQSGTSAIVAGLVQGGMLGQLTGIVLKSIVTPENMIRLAHEKGSLPEKIERIIRDQMGGVGGRLAQGTGNAQSSVGGLFKKLNNSAGGGIIKSFKPGSQPSETQVAKKIEKQAAGSLLAVGIDNIKSFGFAGPLAFDIGFARDPKALKPDLTARMEFKEFDWQLTQVVPQLPQ